ncbi:MAG: toll/interleukin-1 receptor domain-containing protein [Terriglobia bacterium]
MAYKVVVSYSTHNIHIAQWTVQALSRPGITEVFVAEYSLEPGAELDERILAEIRACDMFILLWSRAARQSDWVPAEVGAARMARRLIVPVVLEPNVPLPGFIAQVKHLRAYEDWQGAFTNLKEFVNAQAMEAAQRQKAAVVLGLILAGIMLFGGGGG